MLLAIDIGNSLIKFGLFDGAELLDKFAIATKRDYRFEELQFDRLQFADGRVLNVDTVMVSTVVPDLIDVVREASQAQFKVTPIFVDHGADFGLKINCDPPTSVGIDRLINASSAAKTYGTPVLVCSFGTATVIDAISKDGEFLGGIIAPGMKTMAESLHERGAQLPPIEITRPESLIGNSTASAIRSGVFNGHIAMVEGLIERFMSIGVPKKERLKPSLLPKVIATGGFAKLIATEVKAIDTVDENLTLDGLRLLAPTL